MYLTLYVDKFFYFSPNRDYELVFEQKLKSLTNVDLWAKSPTSIVSTSAGNILRTTT